MNPNSLQAYEKLELTGVSGEQKQRVLFALFTQEPQTRKQLAKTAQMELSAVCGRVNSLMKHGFVEVQERVEGGFGTPVDAIKLSGATRLTIKNSKAWHANRAKQALAGFGEKPEDQQVLTYLKHLKASI